MNSFLGSDGVRPSLMNMDEAGDDEEEYYSNKEEEEEEDAQIYTDEEYEAFVDYQPSLV